MRKIIAITQITLDGIMQAPGGPEEDPTSDFNHGGWAMPLMDEAVDKSVEDILSREFALLLGRRTYEVFAAYWPQAGDNPIANGFNKAKKYVVTNSLGSFDWVNTQGISGDAVEAIRRLKASDGPELHIWGSGELLQALMGADLVDEFRLWIFPVVLGTGKRLFEKGVPPRGLALVESHKGSKGVLVNTYQFTGPLPRGSLAT